MRCTKKTVKSIIEQGNDYSLEVKKNQPKLYQAIEKHSLLAPRVKTYHAQEKSRDRINPKPTVSIYLTR